VGKCGLPDAKFEFMKEIGDEWLMKIKTMLEKSFREGILFKYEMRSVIGIMESMYPSWNQGVFT